MKAIGFVLLIIVVGLAGLIGCSTLQTSLDANATAQQKKAALCEDAQFGLALAEVMLGESADPSTLLYWKQYKAGAALALKTYCLEMEPK